MADHDEHENQNEEGMGLERESVPKLQSGWEKAPTIEELSLDYTDALPDHEAHVTQVDIWLDNLNTKGTALPKARKGRSKVVPKVIRKAAEWRYASLSEPFLDTDDMFNAEPVTAEDKSAAIQNGLILNHQFNHKIQKVAFIDEMVRTGVDEGTVVIFTGWETEEEEFEVPAFKYVPATNTDQIQELQQMMQTVQQGGEVTEEWERALLITQRTQRPTLPIEDGTKTETKIVKNNPVVEVLDYRNVIIDPTCNGDLDKANFIIRKHDISMSDLKKDGKYTNLKYVNVSQSNESSLDGSMPNKTSFRFNDKARKKLTMFEYWGYWDIDGDGTTTSIVAAWIGDTMIRLDKNPFPGGQLPFDMVQYLPVRKAVYGQPDGYLIEDNQKIIGAVTRGMIDIMARASAGQRGYRKDALDVTNKRRFDKGQDYEFNPGVNPTEAFHTHKYDEIPQSASLMLGMQNSDAESLTGVKAFSSSTGISGASLGDSVGGAELAMDATAKREMGILRRYTECLKRVARKIVAMNAVFLEDEEVVRITNEKFVTVRRDDLAGEIDVRLTISTAEANNAKAKELAFMAQTLGQESDAGLRILVLTDIARLRKMPELAERLSNYEPKPDPIAQEMAMAELALKKEEVKLKQAEIQLKLAQARVAGSKSDKDNLDYVEQESGVKQERELEKAGAQADSNIDLAMVNHVLNKELEKSKPKPTTKK